jgi:hypothetical protein
MTATMKLEDNVRGSAAIDVAGASEENVCHVDYRLLENRTEGFLQWWVTSTAALDVDPSMWMMRYLNERFEYSIEERLWFAWLFHTYLLPTTWCLKQEFPDEELASVERFETFVNENYFRLRHERDTKWSRGHLAAMYASYHGWVGKGTQEEKFNKLCQGSPEENFNVLWKEFNGLFKIGRYTAFFLLQTYKQTCEVPIECPSLFLSDYEGSKSHRNGLCFAAGKDEWVNQRLTAAEYAWLEGFGKDLIVEARARWPQFSEEFDHFSLETVACSYKKLWRTANGRYINYYNDRVAEQIYKAEGDGWHGIDWQVLHQCRAECSKGRLKPEDKIRKANMSLFLETGGYHYSLQDLM